ncbi:hypothetical protein A2866_01950 [Candidatus Roizmanbacteria bacterium RIFCSPHIGHO2_01_FULL_39_8]|uniref:Uncharacterized protein n=1 Tax=Candidatus Roizmanbacteria bacterium RIFCSPHIGHO2_01_FULL_39_8 TaxID=1802033 RepID=A0A1F7GPX2_9BACT|nr:MAG: hypothetical protein A2866_01950 [Candidatus Roizmanbacteria bacterium RIFCSPHIGHO2_01_FULL_39_8]
MERKVNSIQPVGQLAELFHQFDAAKHMQQKEALGRQLVTLVTEDSFDYAPIMLVLQKGFRQLDFPKERRFWLPVLNGIDDYINRRFFGQKIIDSNSSDPADLAIYKELIAELEKQKKGFVKKDLVPPSVSQLLHDLQVGFELLERINTPKQGPNSISMPFRSSTLLSIAPEVRRGWEKPFNEISELCAPQAGDVELVPDKVVSSAKKQAGLALEGLDIRLPHIYSDTFGGVSLQELSEEEDMSKKEVREAFGMKVLRYIAHIPKGDVFWQNFIKGVFFAQGDYAANPEAPFPPDSHFTQKILRFQIWLGEKMLLPVVNPKYLDSQFDTAFVEAMEPMSPDTLFRTTGSLYLASALSPQIIQRLNPNITPAEIYVSNDLLISAVDLFLEEAPYQRLAILDIALEGFIRKYWENIRQNWRERFFAHPRELAEIEKNFGFLAQEDPRNISKGAVLHSLERHLGKDFMNKLEVISEDIRSISVDVLATLSRQVKSYWPNPEDVRPLRFNEKKLPHLLGLKDIRYMAGETSEEPVEFMITGQDANTSIVGKMDLVEQKVEFYFDLSDHPSLHTILEHVVIAYFQKSLMVEESVREAKARRPLTTRHEKTSDKKRVSSIYVPRKRYIYANTQEAEGTPANVIDASTASKIIEREMKRKGIFVPRRVVSHSRGLLHSKEYIRLIHRYNRANTDEEREIIKGQIVEARQKMEKPPNKAGVGEYLRTIRDPVVGDDVCYERWISTYNSPRPTDEELRSPQLMYEKYYRDRGPLTDFEDYIISKFLEDLILG